MQVQTPVPSSLSGDSLSQIEAVDVELSVVLGRSVLPMSQLLKMGRGAVIPLDASENDEVWILANNHPFAKGIVVVSGAKISVEITQMLKRPTVYALDTTARAA